MSYTETVLTLRRMGMLGRHTKRWTQGIIFFFLLFLCSAWYFLTARNLEFPHLSILRSIPPSVSRSLHLDEHDCRTVFPGLFKNIDDTVVIGKFPLERKNSMGLIQARIRDGQLFIIRGKDEEALSSNLREAQTAALHQIHRALLTTPDPLPDTVFAVNIQDQPMGTAWSYSSPAYAAPSRGNPPISRAFLMPHFAFWAWPLPFVGSFYHVADAISAIESSLPFSQKSPKPVWRGTRSYNSAHNPKLRDNLLAKTKGASWADVQELEWNETGVGIQKKKVATNSLKIEDFCKYKYVLHTEGVTYSGRFQFLQMCKSIILTPPIVWMQHTTHLVKPLFSSDIRSFDKTYRTKETWEPSEGESTAWPTHYQPDEANIVFVKPDWSDLEEVIEWLEAHGDVAEGIASRQRELFVGKGYLSPAAETCYWRELIRGWSRVVEVADEGWEEQDEISWELFSTM